MFDCVKKGLYDLFRNKLRLFLTVGGIAIGVISVLIISTIGDIGKMTINKQLNNMGTRRWKTLRRQALTKITVQDRSDV